MLILEFAFMFFFFFFYSVLRWSVAVPFISVVASYLNEVKQLLRLSQDIQVHGLPGGGIIWQAELTFIHFFRYRK